MAVITIPTDVLPLIRRQSMGMRYFDMEFASDLTGASQSRALAPPRWTCALVGESDLLPDQAAAWRDFVLSLRSKVNQLAVYDILNAEPRGTFRGSPVLASDVAVGAMSIPIVDATQAGKTWLKGDLFQLGSGATRQLFTVAADVTANGSGEATLTTRQPSRYAQASGSDVVWDKPTCLMRLIPTEVKWDVEGYMTSGFSLDLIESWES